jgi:hypothetical protein
MPHAPTMFFFFIIIYIYSNTKFLLGLPDNNKKNHYENIKKPFEASFNYFFLLRIFWSFHYFFRYSYTNTKLPFNWIDNNKKNHCENTRSPLRPFFFFSKGILVVSLCFWNAKKLIFPWSIWQWLLGLMKGHQHL